MAHVDPIGVTLAGMNVLVAVLLLAFIALALSGPTTTGGNLLFAVIVALPFLALPYRSLLTRNTPSE